MTPDFTWYIEIFTDSLINVPWYIAFTFLLMLMILSLLAAIEHAERRRNARR